MLWIAHLMDERSQILLIPSTLTFAIRPFESNFLKTHSHEITPGFAKKNRPKRGGWIKQCQT